VVDENIFRNYKKVFPDSARAILQISRRNGSAAKSVREQQKIKLKKDALSGNEARLSSTNKQYLIAKIAAIARNCCSADTREEASQEVAIEILLDKCRSEAAIKRFLQFHSKNYKNHYLRSFEPAGKTVPIDDL
jgi:hypothetical protein